MKTLSEYAVEAGRATSRWYGRISSFENPVPPIPIEKWFLAHWERFPGASPDAKATIDHQTQPAPVISFAERSEKLLGATVKAAKTLDRAAGFTGDICQDCGGVRMVRTGTCVTCQDCGSASGGCS